MGDPRRQINKYSTPRHPWEGERIAEEKILLRDYGLKTKKEIWKQASFVKNIKDHVKRLVSSVSTSAEEEKEALIRKLVNLNLLNEGDALDLALELQTKDIMERRLQTQLVRQGFAKTMKQARQFIIHGHIKVGGRKVTSPSYIVNKEEQFALEFAPNSSLSDEEHPERKAPEVASPVVEESPDEEKTEEEKLDEEVSKEIAGKLDTEPVELVAEEVKNGE